ncbi:MAG TPA: molecular chaperone DnaJ [Burkholderiales bacterium]|nr:molecular chaperone DnaJ [Burkholderiales bacterium]
MKSASKAVRIVEQQGQAELSKAQKLFNKLIKKIDDERKRLETWQATIPRYQQKYAKDFDPLLQKFNKARAEFVRLLDNASFEKAFSKSDKAKISEIICPIVVELLAEKDDEELKSIYNRQSGGDFDAEAAEQNEALKSMMEDYLGVDLGSEADFDSPEEMMAHAREKMRQRQEQEAHAEQAREAHRDKRKKSAKTIAKETQMDEDAKNISDSIRDVYRKLASALHPDKEQDALERDRKTILMQRVNVAYGAKDLLKLLELQLEVEQIDQASINTLPEERLKYYNKVLTEQSKELQQEVYSIEMSFKMRFNIPPGIPLSPEKALRSLDVEVKEMEQDIAHLKSELVSFRNIKNLKNWLKSYRIPRRVVFEDDPFGEWR